MPSIVVKDSSLVFARSVVPSPDVIKRLALRFGAGEEDVIVAAAVERRIEVAEMVTAGFHLAHDIEVISEIECVFHIIVGARALRCVTRQGLALAANRSTLSMTPFLERTLSRGISAINRQGDTCYKSGFIGGEVECAVGNFFWFSESPHGMLIGEFLILLGRFDDTGN